jgi:hypothetical protein
MHNPRDDEKWNVCFEQEISIATCIQREEKCKLPVMAFIHKSVGREGIRDLLHLNPMSFTDESEVLAGLRERLLEWTGLAVTGLRVQLRSGKPTYHDGHSLRRLEVTLMNDTNEPITKLNAMVRLRVGILSRNQQFAELVLVLSEFNPKASPHDPYSHSFPIGPRIFSFGMACSSSWRSSGLLAR